MVSDWDEGRDAVRRRIYAGSNLNDVVSETYVITKDNVLDNYKQQGLVL